MRATVPSRVPSISMGHALRIEVVAEGVETLAQKELLQQMGCDQFQGFLCAPGLTPEDLGGNLPARTLRWCSSGFKL